MFTNKEQILTWLNSHDLSTTDLQYIDRGVMTDKYSFTSSGKEYIVRCYQPERSFLAEMEYKYLDDFRRSGIKVPTVVNYQKEQPALLVYEKLQGETLTDVYSQLDDMQKENVCREIVENYKKIANIETEGYGRITDYHQYSCDSWNVFLNDEIQRASFVFKKQKDKPKCEYCKGLKDFADSISLDRGHIVWSDFSTDNIIITNDGHLVGFVDFEGLMAGDPLLGLGYLTAHERGDDFVERILRIYGLNGKERQVDFYSALRYLRLIPYKDMNLPNGTTRTSLEYFIPYSIIKMTEFAPVKNIFSRIFLSKKTYALLLNLVLCVMSLIYIPCLYKEVLSKSQVTIYCKLINVEQNLNAPVWFTYCQDSMSTTCPIREEEKMILRNLVNDSSQIYNNYVEAVNELAYKSNVAYDSIPYLLLLTLCFVMLGCIARTLYDYIGWECYKGGQDMDKWWPWYVYRPFICVPITTLLIVAARTSLFSNLFTSRDLNTYLVVSLLAGFSIMEFLRMLRRVSKTLFEGYNK